MYGDGQRCNPCTHGFFDDDNDAKTVCKECEDGKTSFDVSSDNATVHVHNKKVKCTSAVQATCKFETTFCYSDEGCISLDDLGTSGNPLLCDRDDADSQKCLLQSKSAPFFCVEMIVCQHNM